VTSIAYQFTGTVMTDNQLDSRLETLEIRASHQEAAIDELTRTLLSQEKRIAELAETIKRLEVQLRAMTPSPIDAQLDEPPPHY